MTGVAGVNTSLAAAACSHFRQHLLPECGDPGFGCKRGVEGLRTCGRAPCNFHGVLGETSRLEKWFALVCNCVTKRDWTPCAASQLRPSVPWESLSKICVACQGRSSFRLSESLVTLLEPTTIWPVQDSSSSSILWKLDHMGLRVLPGTCMVEEPEYCVAMSMLNEWIKSEACEISAPDPA